MGEAVKVRYVPLLPVQQGLQALPRNYARFQQYLRTVMNADGTGPELTPLLLANPMAKDHVTALLDALITLGADRGALSAVRLTRLPHAQRGERVQRLLYLNPQPEGVPILEQPVRMRKGAR